MVECEKCGEDKAGGKLYPIYETDESGAKWKDRVLYVCWDCYVQHHREKMDVNKNV